MASAATKAELDKDGIALADLGKVDLDQEDIPLGEAPATRGTAPDAEDISPEGETDVSAGPRSRVPQKWILMAALGLGMLVGLTGLLIILFKPAPQDVVMAVAPPEVLVRPIEDTGEIELDPFFVLFDPIRDDRHGVLIAQVSLQIDPDVVPRVKADLSAIRRILYDRLAGNAQVYSKHEIIAMINQDLKSFDVTKAAFVQYELR